MTINKSGLEIETKDKTNDTEGKFRGDPRKVAGDTSERVNGRAEEAKGKIQAEREKSWRSEDFGKTERKV